jgi:hypothetical protein
MTIAKNEPNFEFICKLPFKYPADRPWIEISIDPENKKFIKYTCKPCTQNIIMKQYSCAGQEINTWYVGQCPFCEKIFYTKSSEA